VIQCWEKAMLQMRKGEKATAYCPAALAYGKNGAGGLIGPNQDLLFDIEVVFLYPWAVIYKDYLAAYGGAILGTMLGFVGILGVAFAYAWKKGALSWNK